MTRAVRMVVGLLLAMLATIPGLLGISMVTHVIIPAWRSGAWGTDSFSHVSVAIGSQSLELEGWQIVAFAIISSSLALALLVAGIIIAFRPGQDKEAG